MTDGQHEAYLRDILHELKQINSKLNNVTTWTFEMPINQETCEHDYPSVWHGIVPPVCSKCGKSAKNLTGIW